MVGTFVHAHAKPCLQRWSGGRSAPLRQRSSGGSRRCSAFTVQAVSIRQLPIFPLNIVAFPTMEVPLTIFEARYRVLFSTLLADAKDIDRDLVQEESPFRGSRQFGMCFVTNQGMADLGTVLEIDNHQTLPDGRIIVTTQGTQRFRVLRVMAQRPVLLAEVEMLDDEDTEADLDEAGRLASEVADKFRALWELLHKLQRVPRDAAIPQPPGDLGPKEFSYWVSSLFADSQPAQQALLQEGSTLRRLKALLENFEQHVQFLRAAWALESIGAQSDDQPEGGSAAQD